MSSTIVNIILIAILVLIIGAAILYVIKSFKSGKKCIGCPDGCSCGEKNRRIENIDLDSCNFETVDTYIKAQGSQENNCNCCNLCKNHK